MIRGALADSPLLERLLREVSDVFDFEVLPLLNPITRALWASVHTPLSAGIWMCCGGRGSTIARGTI